MLSTRPNEQDYAQLIGTGQYGRLYIISGYNLNAKKPIDREKRTFRIFVLPEGLVFNSILPRFAGESFILDTLLHFECAVEVYGKLFTPRGESYYGWKWNGKWQDDFNKLYKEKVKEREQRQEEKRNRLTVRQEREKELLSTY